jgi:hypothetical protein
MRVDPADPASGDAYSAQEFVRMQNSESGLCSDYISKGVGTCRDNSLLERSTDVYIFTRILFVSLST